MCCAIEKAKIHSENGKKDERILVNSWSYVNMWSKEKTKLWYVKSSFLKFMTNLEQWNNKCYVIVHSDLKE